MSSAAPIEVRRYSRPIALSAAAILVILGFAIHAHALLNHDVAWLLVAAQRMVGGGTYSTDFFEVNMPLAIAAYVPSYLLTASAHLSAESAVSFFVAALSVFSAYLSLRHLAAGPEPALDERLVAPYVVWLLVGFLFLPGRDFAQKEHLIAILGLPFLCACANRQGALTLGWRIRCCSAALAAIGFYLKPHYAALPFLLLAGEAWQRKSYRPLLSLEAGILIAIAAADALWTIIKYPDWFVCARWALDLYGAYQTQHWTKLFRPDAAWLCAICLPIQVAVVACTRDLWSRFWPFLVGAAYACLAYLGQHKGWTYQALAAEEIVFAGQGLLVLSLIPTANWNLASATRIASALGGAVLLIFGAARAMREPAPEATVRSIAAGLPGVQRGDGIYAFTVDLKPMFPAIPRLGLEWASRYSHLWPLIELAKAETDGITAESERLLRAYREPFVDSVIDDFDRHAPKYVLVDRRRFADLTRDYDTMEMFLRDPRFAKIWREYVKVGDARLLNAYDVYQKRSPDTGSRDTGP